MEIIIDPKKLNGNEFLFLDKSKAFEVILIPGSKIKLISSKNCNAKFIDIEDNIIYNKCTLLTFELQSSEILLDGGDKHELPFMKFIQLNIHSPKKNLPLDIFPPKENPPLIDVDPITVMNIMIKNYMETNIDINLINNIKSLYGISNNIYYNIN